MEISEVETLRAFFSGKKVFVTGHLGFKGSWISALLAHLGATVKGYSINEFCEDSQARVQFISELIETDVADIRDGERISQSVRDFRPDIIIHMAAQALVLPSFNDPKETWDTNVIGLLNLHEAARQLDSLGCFLNVTSDKCYENADKGNRFEESDPLGGKDPYSASKAAAEILTRSYFHSFYANRETQCAIVTARAGNVIGGADWSAYRLIPDIFRALRRNTALTLRNPAATRPWQHVLDPVYGYLILAKAAYEKPATYSGPWNLGPKENVGTSVGDLVERFRTVCPALEYTVEHNPEALVEAKLLQLECRKIREALNWEAIVDQSSLAQITAEDYLREIQGDAISEIYSDRVENYLNARERQISTVGA